MLVFWIYDTNIVLKASATPIVMLHVAIWRWELSPHNTRRQVMRRAERVIYYPRSWIRYGCLKAMETILQQRNMWGSNESANFIVSQICCSLWHQWSIESPWQGGGVGVGVGVGLGVGVGVGGGKGSEVVPLMGMYGMVSRALIQDYLTPDICSLIKPAAMGKLCYFSPKSKQLCYNPF